MVLPNDFRQLMDACANSLQAQKNHFRTVGACSSPPAMLPARVFPRLSHLAGRIVPDRLSPRLALLAVVGKSDVSALTLTVQLPSPPSDLPSVAAKIRLATYSLHGCSRHDPARLHLFFYNVLIGAGAERRTEEVVSCSENQNTLIHGNVNSFVTCQFFWRRNYIARSPPHRQSLLRGK